MKAHVANVLTGAPTLAAVALANAAIAAVIAANAAAALLVPPGPVAPIPAAAVGVANVLPSDWLPRLWRWMDTNIGAAVQNGMLDSNHIMEAIRVKQYDDGGVYTADGEEVVAPLEPIDEIDQSMPPTALIAVTMLYGILLPKFVRDPVFARRRPSGPSIVSACHDGTRLAHTGELRLSETLGMVDGREPNAMTAIRARVPDGWTTFRGDEEGF